MPSVPGYPPGTGKAGVGLNSAEPQEFPIPFAISGVKPNPAFPKSASPPRVKQPTGDLKPKAPATGTPTKPAVDSDDDEEPYDLPDPTKRTAKSTPTKKTAKPVTIDPKLLKRALQNRNGSRN